MKLLKILAGLLAALILLLVAAPLVVTQFVDPNDYKDEITTAVKEQTGRDLSIGGDIQLSFFPWLGADIGDIHLGNAPGFTEPTFASLKSVQVRVKLLPLLSERLEMDTVTIDGLALNLERAEDGSSNWDDLVQGQQPAMDDGTASPGALAALAIGGVDLRGAQLSWRDVQAGQFVKLSNLSARTGVITPGRPLEVSLSFDLERDAPQLSGHIETSTEISLDLEQQVYRAKDLNLQATLSGAAIPGGSTTVSLGGDLVFDGPSQTVDLSGLKIDLKGVSLAELSADVTVTGNAHGTLAKQLFSVPDLEVAATLAGDKIPGGSIAITMRTAVRADLTAQTLAATGLKLEVPALALDGVSGSMTIAANIATQLDGQDIAVTDFRATGTLTGEKLQDPTLEFDAKADLGIDLAKGDYRATGITVAGTITGDEVPGGEMPLAFGADIKLTNQLSRLAIDKLRIAAAGIKASGKLTVKEPLGEPTYQGTLKVAKLNPRELLQLLGQAVPETSDPKTLRSLTLETEFAGGLNKVALEQLDMTLDGSRVQGSIDLPSFDGSMLRFNLTLDKMNVDRYLPPSNQGRTSAAPATPGAAAAAGVALPVDMLRALDIKGLFRADSLTVSGVKLQKVKVALKAEQGNIAVKPIQASLYGGKYTGNIRLDASGKTATVSLDEKISGIRIDKLLADLGIDPGELDLSGGKSSLVVRGKVSGDPAANQFTLSGLDLRADLAVKSFPGGRLKAGLGGDLAIDLNKQTIAARTLSVSFANLKVTSELAVTELLGEPRFAGTLKVAKFSPRKLLKKLGQPPIATSDKTALRSAELTSTFSGSTTGVDLKALQIRLDDTTLEGNLTIDNFARPAIRYSLNIDAIDADRYLPRTSKKPVATPGAAAAAVPVETLRALNVEGELRIGKLKISNLRLSNVHLTTKAKDGVIALHPAGADLYQGVYAGNIRIDASGKQPKLSVNETLTGVQAGPLLKDLQGQAVVTGVADVSASPDRHRR